MPKQYMDSHILQALSAAFNGLVSEISFFSEIIFSVTTKLKWIKCMVATGVGTKYFKTQKIDNSPSHSFFCFTFWVTKAKFLITKNSFFSKKKPSSSGSYKYPSPISVCSTPLLQYTLPSTFSLLSQPLIFKYFTLG